ncbi:TadA family conjugal transfer-associated ATPase [Citricoccus sp. I39-566]|uniref:TadA family conjugal transfer-associated ATPase n=1 Tax=Citricoccus sp. I39-566 TaxID=3073268 RepID=UPI00286CA980|nr:TadA family conjugal transfer-associated ATPase [Citricoccus sp. I39-566]WMY78306.1 TadA family conjugal transfer-associated ATPase [Citricoccus sp. I39-566]
MSTGWSPEPPRPAGRRRTPGPSTVRPAASSGRSPAAAAGQPGLRSPGQRRARRWLAGRLADPARQRSGAEGARPEAIPPELAAEAVRRHLPAVTPQEAAVQMRAVADDLTGLGPLADPARTPGVTDVLVDGDGTVWTDGMDGLRDTGRRVDAEDARRLAIRLLAQGGRRLDEGQPFGDAQVTGARVHAILPPLAAGGTQISVRLAAPEPPGLSDLARDWPHGEVWLAALRHLVQSRANLLISGATGSGKTTLLSALLSEVPADERIITVEDTRELRPRHGHVVSLQARSGNAEGAGGVPLAELVRQALRMRPDRLIVGECRGAEVADFLAAMNTGHRGAAGTLHANSATDVPARLFAMGALAGLGAEALALQASSAVDAILHLERTDAGRHPVELALVDRSGSREGTFRVVPAWSLTGRALTPGPGRDLLEAVAGAAGRRGGGRHALDR